MHALRTNTVRQLMAAMLTLSLCVCCCHAGWMLQGLSDVADDAACETSSCCASGDAAPAQSDNEPDSRGCQTCCVSCIKGLGPKDGVQAVPVVTHLLLDLPAAITTVPTPVRTVRSPLGDAPPYVEPMTLLRLRCALVV
jgi:hypothetical protein